MVLGEGGSLDLTKAMHMKGRFLSQKTVYISLVLESGRPMHFFKNSSIEIQVIYH